MNKTRLKLAAKIILAALLLNWFLRESDIREIYLSLRNLSGLFLIAAVSLSLANLLIKSIKWRLLLPHYSLLKLIKLNFISQFYAIFSAGFIVGEAAKVYIMGKGKEEAGLIAMSVIMDKITGIIGLIIVALFGVFFSPAMTSKKMIWLFAGMIFLFLVVIFLMRLKVIYDCLAKVLTRLKNRTVKAKKHVELFLKLLDAWQFYSRKIRLIFTSVFLGIIFQLVLAAVYFTLGKGLGVYVPFFDWCWILGILTAVVVIPVTIGGLGLREASLVGLLGYFMIAQEKALALSFSIFGVQLILAMIGAIFEVKRFGLFDRMNVRRKSHEN